MRPSTTCSIPASQLDAILYAVLALTVVRVVPVMLALRGTDISRRDALFLGWMGPRGLASLVFGLLAVIGLHGSASNLAAEVMVTMVLLSVLAHGASVRPIAPHSRAPIVGPRPWKRLCRGSDRIGQ